MDAEILAEFAVALAAEEGQQSAACTMALAAAMEAKQVRFLIAEYQGGAIGMVMFYPGYDLESAGHGMHLGDLYVVPTMRRQGVARRLVKALAEITLQEGGQWVSLTVLKENKRAQRLYRSLGMLEIPVRFMAIGTQGLHHLARTGPHT